MAKTPPTPLISILGYAAMLLLGILMAVQLFLAVGILPVSMAWGGGYSELTPSLRLSSLGAFLILLGFAYILGRRSGILGLSPPSLMVQIMSWLITIYLVFSAVMDFLSPIPAERWIFGPLSLVLVLVCLMISVIKPPQVGVTEED
jgi:hypothetical protein